MKANETQEQVMEIFKTKLKVLIRQLDLCNWFAPLLNPDQLCEYFIDSLISLNHVVGNIADEANTVFDQTPISDIEAELKRLKSDTKSEIQ